MIRCVLSLAAARVIVDQRTNQASAVDILESVGGFAFPLQVPSVTFIFFTRRDSTDPNTGVFNVRCAVGDTEIFSSAVEADFQQGLANRSIIALEGFPIPHAGLLVAILSEGQRELGRVEISVDQIELPQAVAPATH